MASATIEFETTLLLNVQIPGTPVPKGRPRFSTAGGRPRSYTPEATRDWEAYAATLLKAAWKGKAPLDEPCVVLVQAVFPRPVRAPKRESGRLAHAVRPDVDNLAKAALDALCIARVLIDDGRVVELRASKWVAAIGEHQHVRVQVCSWRAPSIHPAGPLQGTSGAL